MKKKKTYFLSFTETFSLVYSSGISWLNDSIILPRHELISWLGFMMIEIMIIIALWVNKI